MHYLEMIQILAANGFALWGLIPGFLDPATGRVFEMDGIFFKEAVARWATDIR